MNDTLADVANRATSLPLTSASPAEQRRAAISVAEAAIAGDWTDDLPMVLAQLGLDHQQAS
ncbi:MAG: hypothetical protein F2667_14200 [Actinobacteria bacterium]|uniref:Unannotated protein n=1 Tax=freshwater metagenome TaxID=449393 RepID=A0A6J6SFV1_9ZZZZ|nr:hypothetical protein [Actinomycetota bacterium]